MALPNEKILVAELDKSRQRFEKKGFESKKK
jgi:hypothetical protein